MDDKTDSTAAVTVAKAFDSTDVKPDVKPDACGKLLPIRAIRVIPEPHARTPGNEPMDIVEVELGLVNDGNFAWHQWMDNCLRFRVERGHADEALREMGLK